MKIVRDQRVAVFGHMDSPHVLAEMVRDVTGARMIDATFVARATPGLLPAPFTLAEAESLVTRLKPVGIQAAVVEETTLPLMDDAFCVHHARIGETALEVCNVRGDVAASLPWQAIAVIAVGRVPGGRHSRFADDGRPTVLSAAPLPNVGHFETPERSDLELWLLGHATTAVYRMKHDEFNYETLGEARADSATVNFDRFVRRLTEKATHARQTPGTYAFLHNQSMGCEFKSSEAVQQQALLAWILERGLPVSAS